MTGLKTQESLQFNFANAQVSDNICITDFNEVDKKLTKEFNENTFFKD
jgi:hypothetical protein